jgi:hypothetical protein
MKFEHKLSAGAAEAIAETQRIIRQMSDRYFNLLGQAKDAETEAMAQQKILQRQIALIQQLEKLPESRMPYMVNAEGTALIGEVPEPAPAAAETKPDSVWPRMTNGSGAVIEMARED